MSGLVLPERFQGGPFVCHDTLVPPHMLRDVLATGLITQSGGGGEEGCWGSDVDGRRGSRDTRSPPKVAHAKERRDSLGTAQLLVLSNSLQRQTTACS